jgi:DedD protein
MADPADVNVDDLRRRARRRLVGAIVLALAAAVFVPMLLESDPKPLGEDVSVRIPPVDDGKFVTRLNDTTKTPAAKPTAPKADARTEAKPEPAKTEPAKMEPAKADSAKTEPAKTDSVKMEPPNAESPKTEPARAETGTSARTSEATSTAAASTPAAPSGSLAPPPATPASSPAVAAIPSAPVQSEPALAGFSVQLAAFSDSYGANALANKLKKSGYPAYTEPLVTNKGTTLWRVRVGPYPSRDAAVSSRDKLKGDGYTGIVAAAK